MQAAVLRSRCGCNQADQKAWVRQAVLIPLSAGRGPGIHAEYDEANVLAAAVALRMKYAQVVVSRYAGAFAQLQTWLRERSTLEWPRYSILLNPETLSVLRHGTPLDANAVGFLVNLEAAYASICDHSQTGQLPLAFGLSLTG